MGHNVIAVDNFITGSKKNIDHLQQFQNFSFVNHDIIEYRDFKVDGIFNLACPASPPLYQKDPVRTVKTNVIGSTNLLELARKTNSRILQASTSEIYGDPKVSPQTEEYWGNVNPVGLRSCYDEGKRTAETLFMDFHRQYETDIRIARIFNTYGPRMSIYDGRVVSNFIVQSLTNKDLTIYGDGGQIRSFCYVDDLIIGLIKLFFKENCHHPINIGNPDPITMEDLAVEVIKLTKSKSKISHMPLPSDDPINRIPDISKAIDQLNWKPSTSRSEGLKKTIEYFSKELKIAF
jgi:UDP-glucuronate decarboxylase